MLLSIVMLIEISAFVNKINHNSAYKFNKIRLAIQLSRLNNLPIYIPIYTYIRVVIID